MTIKNHSNIIKAGIDDVTKCPCIGSIFIAGVVADEKTIRKWKRAGVKDSKLIARKKREKLAELIKSTAIAYSIQEVTPAMIDDKRLNLNSWEMGVVLNIIQMLHKKITIHELYIDNWEVNQELFWQRLEYVRTFDFSQLANPLSLTLTPGTITSMQTYIEHRADTKYTIVGAASILAKTASDAQYDEYKKIYGEFGSGSPADPATRKFVWEHRHNPPPIIRKSWNTYKTLVELNDLQQDWIYNRGLIKKRFISTKT
jgi:ribonuclease HII